MGRPLIAHGWSDVIEPDYAEVRRAWAVLAGDGLPREIRALPFGKSATCRNATEACAAVKEWAAARGLYVTLNPVRPDLDKAATNGDVSGRYWILIDIDPIRPADVSSTDGEKGFTTQLADVVIRGLAERGWSMPVILDSGNGIHLLYRVDLPNDTLAAQWVRSILFALDAAYSNEQARIDKSVHNAARISKIPGTWTRKGADTPERPHRMARILHVPEPLTAVGLELMRDLIGHREEEPPKAKAKLRLRATSGAGPDAYCRAALAGECAAVALAPDGDRNNQLNRSAFALGTLVHLRVFDRPEVEAALRHAARRAGLPDREIDRTIASGLDAGLMEPREVPHQENGKAKEGAKFVPDADTTETIGRSGRVYKFPLILKGEDVEPLPVEWLWRDRIPYSFLTLMAGKTGVGKSFTTLDIVARVTIGGEIPLGNGECFERGHCLIISEDDHRRVLAPRLIEAGADRRRYGFLSWEAMAEFTLADAEMLDDCYYEAGEPKLVVIDPPTNFLGNKDEHRNAEVRSVLMGVSIWAMRHDVACVMITHCNKGIKKDIAALDRVIGSIAWASTSRIAHIFSSHPDERGQSVFIPLKNNLGPLADGLAYRIVETETFARVEWLGNVDFDADDAMSGILKKPRGVAAVEWLAERFAEQREWRSDELKRDAAEAGVSKNALWSPEVLALPIRKTKRADATGDIHWFWIAEEGWPPEITGNVGNLGNLDTPMDTT